MEGWGAAGRLVISTQVLQEFYVGVTRKLAKPLPPDEGERAARHLLALNVTMVDVDMVFRVMLGSREYQLSFWDALIIEAALAAGLQAPAHGGSPAWPRDQGSED